MTKSCATCRHLRKRYPHLERGVQVEPGEFEYQCGFLFVVRRHRYQTPFEAGDIATWNQVQRWQLATEPLVIVDPERTETNSAGAVIREGVEPFACRAWNSTDPNPPDRWPPKTLYDVRWNPYLSRYVRRKEAA